MSLHDLSVPNALCQEHILMLIFKFIIMLELESTHGLDLHRYLATGSEMRGTLSCHSKPKSAEERL